MMPMKTSNFSPFELNAGIPPMLQIKNKYRTLTNVQAQVIISQQ